MITEKQLRWPKYRSSYRHRIYVHGMNMETEFNDNITKALIIPGPFQQNAEESCKKFNLKTEVLDSFYYPDKVKANFENYKSDAFRVVETPKSLSNDSWPQHIKLYSKQLTYFEVCRILNHMIAWDYSVKNNEPVIILENDAVLLEEHTYNPIRFNSITMLGDISYHYHNNNWICAKGVYAYAVDPFVAKNLFNKIMSEGLINPLELIFRLDEFNVVIQKKACRFNQLFSREAILDST